MIEASTIQVELHHIGEAARIPVGRAETLLIHHDGDPGAAVIEALYAAGRDAPGVSYSPGVVLDTTTRVVTIDVSDAAYVILSLTTADTTKLPLTIWAAAKNTRTP